jgi:hypothetical protein
MSLASRRLAPLLLAFSLRSTAAFAQRTLDDGVAPGDYLRARSGASVRAMLLPRVGLGAIEAVTDLDGDRDEDILTTLVPREGPAPAWFALMRDAGGYCAVPIAPHQHCVPTCDVLSYECRPTTAAVLRVAGRVLVAVSEPRAFNGVPTEYALFSLRGCGAAVERWRETLDAPDLRFVVAGARVELRSRRAAVRVLSFDASGALVPYGTNLQRPSTHAAMRGRATAQATSGHRGGR